MGMGTGHEADGRWVSVGKHMKKIDLMHATFGFDVQGRACKDCPCLMRTQPTKRTCYKCTVYGVSASESTDWACKWLACGRFGKPLEPGEYTMMHMRKRRTNCLDK